MKNRNQITTFNKMIALCVCAAILSAVSVAEGYPRINMCLEDQYNGDGESIDISKCWWIEYSCGGNCYKYEVNGDTSECKQCVTSGARFWTECDDVGGITWLTGTKSHANCTKEFTGCGCDENWTPDSSTQVPCYHHSGDSCWF